MKPKFYRKALRNGMTLVFEKRDIPVVSVVFAVRNGAINEDPKEKGISHYIEHMLYKGTPKRNAKQISEAIEKNGGDFNGFTSEDLTGFHCKMPSKHLGLALDVLSDMIKNPLFDEEELKKERKVIFEEIKLYHDNPVYYVHSEYQKYMYGGTLGMPIIGTHDTMNSIDRKKITDKFKQIYKPNNMILCVVGDADFNKLVKFVENNFSNEKGEVPEQKIINKTASKTEKRKGIDQANLVFAYHVPLAGDKKTYAARVLSTLMASGLSSRLFLEIREKRNLAYGVGGHSEISKRYAHSMVYIGTTKEAVNQVKKLVVEEYSKVSKDLTESELGTIKNQMIGNWQISMEDSQKQMVSLLSSEIDGNAKDFYDFGKNIKSVKLKDVKDIAKKASKQYCFFALVPE